jgi:hypothetical protein
LVNRSAAVVFHQSANATPTPTLTGRRRAIAATSARIRLLPIPAPPSTKTTVPTPERSWSRCPPRAVSSMSRPRTGCVGPHYLLKPFSFPALRDKLLSYGQMRSRRDTLHEPDQRNLDRVFGALRAPDQLAGAKGRSAHTLEAVERLLASGTQEMSAAEVAEQTGMSGPPRGATSATCTRSAASRSGSPTAAAGVPSTPTSGARRVSADRAHGLLI